MDGKVWEVIRKRTELIYTNSFHFQLPLFLIPLPKPFPPLLKSELKQIRSWNRQKTVQAGELGVTEKEREGIECVTADKKGGNSTVE